MLRGKTPNLGNAADRKARRLEGAARYSLFFALLGGKAPTPETGFVYVPGAHNINRVKNPGFEYVSEADGGYGDIPRYWNRSPVYSGQNSTFYLSAAARHGRFACAIHDTSSTTAAGLESGDISVTPGYVYQAAVWARRNSEDGNAIASLYLRWYDGAGTLLGSAPSQSTTNTGYTRLTLAPAAAPANAAFARLLLYSPKASTGTVYFDSASLLLTEQCVDDGDFSGQAEGSVPEHWKPLEPAAAGNTQTIHLDGGNKVLRIEDASASAPSGVCYQVPVSPRVPYQFTVKARRVGGSGEARATLKFFDAENHVLFITSRRTSLTDFTTFALEGTAGQEAVCAKLYLYSSEADTGTFDFDAVSFAENYPVVKQVSPASATTGNPVWDEVAAAAQTGPVKVVFQDGTYSGHLQLDQMGNAHHEIVLEAEHPFGVLYNDTPAAAQQMIWLTRSRNISIRHFHFSYADGKDPLEYCLSMGTVLDESMACRDIRIQGCDLVDGMPITRGFSGAHGTTSNVVWEACSVVWAGVNDRAHAFYSMKAKHLAHYDCYTEDVAGAPIKFKDDCRDVLVQDCTLVNTATYPTIYTNPWLVYIEAVNTRSGSHETLPSGVVLTNCTFEYLDPGAGGARAPVMVKMEGGAPAGFGDLYMIPQAEGEYIQNTGNPVAIRNSKINAYCDYDLMGGTDLAVGDCTFIGCGTMFSRLWRKEPQPEAGYYEGLIDLDALLDLD